MLAAPLCTSKQKNGRVEWSQSKCFAESIHLVPNYPVWFFCAHWPIYFTLVPLDKIKRNRQHIRQYGIPSNIVAHQDKCSCTVGPQCEFIHFCDGNTSKCWAVSSVHCETNQKRWFQHFFFFILLQHLNLCKCHIWFSVISCYFFCSFTYYLIILSNKKKKKLGTL